MGKVFREFFTIPIEDWAEVANFILGFSTSHNVDRMPGSLPSQLGEAEGLTNDH